ncbi:hypothetical protein GCK72_019423 [Caenorhabditis remanei]|uniref:Uncharacterized protein n=1 Tax=Caenorhabditis remanei TaxID=31234 RepID=A0A6A5GCL0_CAERE|nr:hypothetical protein GCK72_019423 [Caenorhabditis remanei]KAF1752868.1 hypothetical protein GCK72_019423 [Caenorhabditis remanei]
MLLGKSGARPTPSQPFGSPLRPPSIGKKSKNDAQMGNEPVGHNNKLKNLLIVGQANSHHSEVGPDLQHLYEPKTTSPSIAPIEYNVSMFSLSFYAPSFPLAPLFAPVLGHEYQLWNYYGNSPIYNLNVAQEPSMPISSQTSNDVVNILEVLGVNQLTSPESKFPSASVSPFSQTSSGTTTASDVDISYSPFPIPSSGAMNSVNEEDKGEKGIELIPEFECARLK